MLGGGGYSVPKWLLAGRSGLSSGDFTLDVVEIDPAMTEAARRFFFAPTDDPRMRIVHEDARVFINRAAAKLSPDAYGPYDLIFADIFNSWYTVPFHVGTRETAAKIRRLLSRDGIYIMNIISAVTGDNGRLLRAIRNAFAEEFGQAHVFPVQSRFNGEMVQNVMLMVTRENRELPDPTRSGLTPDIRRMLANRWTSPFPPAVEDVPALMDDYAPVERYTLGFKP
jgi:spermidine synthase